MDLLPKGTTDCILCGAEHVGGDGLHGLSCPSTKAERTQRHSSVQHVVEKWSKKLDPNQIYKHAPALDDYFERLADKGGVENNAAAGGLIGDTAVEDPTGTRPMLVIDYVIAHGTGGSAKAGRTVRGGTAAKAAAQKVMLYTKHYKINSSQVLGFALEQTAFCLQMHAITYPISRNVPPGMLLSRRWPCAASLKRSPSPFRMGMLGCSANIGL